jgi:hypothetical protein
MGQEPAEMQQAIGDRDRFSSCGTEWLSESRNELGHASE